MSEPSKNAEAVPLSRARSDLGPLVRWAASRRERVILTDRGRPVGAIVGLAELAELDAEGATSTSGRGGGDLGAVLEGSEADVLRHGTGPQLQDLHAERAVLGGLLVHRAVGNHIVAALDERDFAAATHRVLFAAAVQALDAGEDADPVNITRALSRAGRGELALQVHQLAAAAPPIAAVRHYAAIVHDLTRLRGGSDPRTDEPVVRRAAGNQRAGEDGSAQVTGLPAPSAPMPLDAFLHRWPTAARRAELARGVMIFEGAFEEVDLATAERTYPGRRAVLNADGGLEVHPAGSADPEPLIS